MDYEILFRGKRLDNGEWIEGFYVHLRDGKGNESHRIYTGYAETDCDDFYPDWFEVDPATVGRYIGVKDKNGAMIFEGDAIRCLEKHMKGQCFEVWWSKGCCGFSAGRGIRTRPNLNQATVQHYEIAGNIHDNPELAEVRDETD